MMQKLMCTVGRDKVRCIVFLPCNHVLAFERCGYQANICMTCNTMVKENLKIIRAKELENCRLQLAETRLNERLLINELGRLQEENASLRT
ncbi:hypothetical protein DPMN_050201 [Dreissena polymorpha]|uniref:Uncharacterized protein n=1 Tax=Dreissena polymorpha TaxID=45954 RepID=A0A9D4CHD4_DREPO|nr:hypothetical protein DPMN_050201 [Dreissena polymorpha]